MSSTHQAQIIFKNLSSQAKQTEILPTLHSSLFSVGQLCDNECIVIFYKYRVIVRKNKEKIIEGYQYPMKLLWRLPLHDPAQSNQE